MLFRLILFVACYLAKCLNMKTPKYLSNESARGRPDICSKITKNDHLNPTTDFQISKWPHFCKLFYTINWWHSSWNPRLRLWKLCHNGNLITPLLKWPYSKYPSDQRPQKRIEFKTIRYRNDLLCPQGIYFYFTYGILSIERGIFITTRWQYWLRTHVDLFWHGTFYICLWDVFEVLLEGFTVCLELELTFISHVSSYWFQY